MTDDLLPDPEFAMNRRCRCSLVAIDPASAPDAPILYFHGDADGALHMDSTIGPRPDIETIRRAIDFSQVRQASDFLVDVTADPILDTDLDWEAQSAVCCHVCGPDPGHCCDARATVSITHPLPSGGTRTLPLCGPCAAAESLETTTA